MDNIFNIALTVLMCCLAAGSILFTIMIWFWFVDFWHEHYHKPIEKHEHDEDIPN